MALRIPDGDPRQYPGFCGHRPPQFIQDDELIEVTPDAIRLRKRVLEPNQRKKAAKQALQPA